MPLLAQQSRVNKAKEHRFLPESLKETVVFQPVGTLTRTQS